MGSIATSWNTSLQSRVQTSPAAAFFKSRVCCKQLQSSIYTPLNQHRFGKPTIGHWYIYIYCFSILVYPTVPFVRNTWSAHFQVHIRLATMGQSYFGLEFVQSFQPFQSDASILRFALKLKHMFSFEWSPPWQLITVHSDIVSENNLGLYIFVYIIHSLTFYLKFFLACALTLFLASMCSGPCVLRLRTELAFFLA